MFIRLINNTENRKGDPIIINVNSIISVYENHVDGGSLSTVIFGQNDLTWNVEESLEEVYNKIESSLKRI